MRRVLLLWSVVSLVFAAKASAQDPLQCSKGPPKFVNLPGSFWDPTTKTGKLVGNPVSPVSIECDDTTVFADEITWDEKVMRAKGSVLLVQTGLRVTAESVEVDRVTHLGTFYKAAGTARLTERDVERGMFGTLEPEVSFYAERIEKTGPRTYKMTNGWFSTCVQANPRWDFKGSSGTITLDERLLLRNAVLRVKGVPVFYLPVIYYPMEDDGRSTGFLLPTYSTSNIKGQGLSTGFFWALGRSHDATFYYDWFSKAGPQVSAEYRFISAPGSNGNLMVSMLDEKERRALDGTLERHAHRSYNVRGAMNQAFGPRQRFRAIGRVSYTTDISTLGLYNQNSYEATRRTRDFTGSVSGDFGRGRYRFTGQVRQSDYFTSLTSAQRLGRLPQLTLSMAEKPFSLSGPGSRFSFGANADLSGIQNQADITQPSTDRGLWRLDVSPTISASLGSARMPFLDGRAAAAVRFTHWTDSLDPVTNTPEPVAVSRQLLDLRAEITGPKVAKVFQTPKNGYAQGFKHLIEPRVSVQWLSPFDNLQNIINNDYGVDCLVGGNATVAYSLFNRVYAKRKMADGSDRTPEIFWASISQSYYTSSTASACDTQYQATSVGQFSAVQIAANVSPVEEVSGRFQMFIDSKTRQPQSYSASVSTYGRLTQLTAVWTKRNFLPNVPGYDFPDSANHAVSGWGALRSPSGRVSGSFGLKVDLKDRRFLEQRVTLGYSAQCCGISVDYQVLNLQHLNFATKTDHRFNFSFTLAGIGSFSNPLGSFGR